MRIALKDIFVFVALCAFVAWCGAQAGTQSELFWISVIASGFMSTLFVCVAGSESHHGRAWFAPVPFLVLCAVPLASLFLLVDSLALIFLGIFCAGRPVMSDRRLCLLVMVLAAAACFVGVLPGMARMREWAELQREFPAVSLNTRLAYEHRDDRPQPKGNLQLSTDVQQQLTETEQDLDVETFRNALLEQIHDREYERFVRSNGFGVDRMLRPRPEYIRQPPLRDIPFVADTNGHGTAKSDEPDATYRNRWQGLWATGRSNDVKHLHEASRNDFFDPDGFGAVIQPLLVAGFIAHAFHHSPTQALDDRRSWQIERIELVSLLRFDEPRVYVLDHLPRMDQISSDDVPTRPLDAFETTALPQLRTQRDIVVAQQADKYRMLGSLRASKQCLECHTAARGELLGAFSYVLLRGNPAVPPNIPDTPGNQTARGTASVTAN